MALHVRALDTFDDPEQGRLAYLGVDAAAFGWPLDPAQVAAKVDLVDPARYLLAEWDGEPVGGAGSFEFDLTLPGGVQVGAAGVSDVGVVPTHRRRGVLSALMREQLGALVDSGVGVAVLHASEGGIYRRFGYGPCTSWRQVRIDTRRTEFRADCPDAGGTLHLHQRDAARSVCEQVHDAVRRAVPGGISRSATWWDAVFGDVDIYLGGTAAHLVLEHRDAGGRPDGYAIYKVDHDWSAGQANHTLSVWELLGESVEVELALWRALIEHDLVATVVGPISVDHALSDVVVDARQVGVDWHQDLLWARPLDIAALLSARRYSAPGRLVLGVEDPFLPELGGTFELCVDDRGVGECRRCDAEPQLGSAMTELGSVLLGGSSWRRLARAGRVVTASPDAADLADSMFAVDPLPWCWVRF